MITPRRYQSRAGFVSRAGFTLTELLIAITVIAILVGMLSAAIIPVMASAKRTAILVEMKQIEMSLEQFKSDYGFYPPSWLNIRLDQTGTAQSDIACATELLRYINRIAPNNSEGAGALGSRPIDTWWTTIGTNINHEAGEDLVFWLSGLTKNKQTPLSGGGGVAYDDGTVERNVFYEFRKPQLVVDAAGVAASYEQTAASEAPFLYIDKSSYGLSGSFDGYYVWNQLDAAPANWYNSYENPDSFQLICWGLDKLPGFSTQWAIQTPSGLITNAGPDKMAGTTDDAPDLESADNLCNFCEGPLERYIEGTFESPAVK